jgi:hypothetical protein
MGNQEGRPCFQCRPRSRASLDHLADLELSGLWFEPREHPRRPGLLPRARIGTGEGLHDQVKRILVPGPRLRYLLRELSERLGIRRSCSMRYAIKETLQEPQCRGSARVGWTLARGDGSGDHTGGIADVGHKEARPREAANVSSFDPCSALRIVGGRTLLSARSRG